MDSRSTENLIYRAPIAGTVRAPRTFPPPGGATLASFVLFVSLGALLGIVYMGSEWMSLSHGFGFPTDLAWVRVVFARSLATGHGLAFSSGPPVAGVAAPSWIASLAFFGFLSGDFILAAKVLGVLSVILAALLAWAIVLRLVEDWRFAFLAGLLVVINPLLGAQALGGTEGPFAGMLVLAVVYWQTVGWEGPRWSRIVSAFAVALGALARPELFLLLPLAFLDRWLIAALHARPGRQVPTALLRSVPEAAGAVLIMLPYALHNLRFGGFWQRPEVALRALPPLAWSKAVLAVLWANSPAVLVLAVLGLVVAAMSAARARTDHPSFLPVALPAALLLLPGFLWPDMSGEAAATAAGCLTPLVVVLGVAGLMVPYRFFQRTAEAASTRGARLAFAGLIGLFVIALCGFTAWGHRAAWRQYGDHIKRIADLQVALGEWAAQHLPPDASIASREVGALGYFSGKRMIDLGGTTSPKGMTYLRRSGAFDSNLLAFMQEVQPSHLVIRGGDIPDLARRPDIVAPVITRTDVDRITGGSTTLTLYETMWKPASIRAVEAVER
jgi:hypothetical protein